MDARFDAFVLFAEMRTGSNHLEESLDAMPGLAGHGEVFNPVFLGSHDRTDLFGIDMAARAADPLALLQRLVTRPGMNGFRFFHDHDPRVLDAILDDPRIAKVLLTRNPLDSYVSLTIASQTGQWRLIEPGTARTRKVAFVGREFDALVDRQRDFRERIERRMRVTGQAAFRIAYEDIGDLEVLNGLGGYLGAQGPLRRVPDRLKRQNPGEVEEKVSNPEEMRRHLATLDPFLLSRAVDVAPPRGPAVPTFMAGARSPLLALPIPGGPDRTIRDWLTALDGTAPAEGLTQKTLRPWMRRNEGFVSFAVVRHPLARAYHAFHRVRSDEGEQADTVRRVLSDRHDVDPDAPDGPAFLAFLAFLRANLNGQTSLPTAPEWAPQTALLAGMAQAVLPQRLIREGTAQDDLDRLAALSEKAAPVFDLPDRDAIDALATAEIDDACKRAYRRDYLAMGFGKWSGA